MHIIKCPHCGQELKGGKAIPCPTGRDAGILLSHFAEVEVESDDNSDLIQKMSMIPREPRPTAQISTIGSRMYHSWYCSKCQCMVLALDCVNI